MTHVQFEKHRASLFLLFLYFIFQLQLSKWTHHSPVLRNPGFDKPTFGHGARTLRASSGSVVRRNDVRLQLCPGSAPSPDTLQHSGPGRECPEPLSSSHPPTPPQVPSVLRKTVSQATWLDKLCRKLEFKHPCSWGLQRALKIRRSSMSGGLMPCDLMKVFPLPGDLTSVP